MDNLDGISMLGQIFANDAEKNLAALPIVIDFGVIGEDLSLKTNSFPIEIPASDYLVCRGLTLGAVDKVLYHTKKDGKHAHGSSGAHGGHSAGDGAHQHPEEAPHTHEVLISEKMRSIKAGDRVLVAWVGNDAVVVDLIFPAKEAFTFNV